MLSRRSRTSVAAQACETCRRRKTKCDELRPKCTLCQRLNLECVYKEPPSERLAISSGPSSISSEAVVDPVGLRKDDAMASIINTLSRLETKVDKISLASSANSPYRYFSGEPSSSPWVPTVASSDAASSNQADPAPGLELSQEDHPPLAIPHKVLVWPSICFELIQTGNKVGLELEAMAKRGTPWLIRQAMERFGKEFPFEVGLPLFRSEFGISESSYTPMISFPDLGADMMKQLADSYFSTFNVLYPILDQNQFMDDVLPQVLTSGFKYGEAASVLALLVFALGQVGIDGIYGAPLANLHGIWSGVRGGSPTQPPGLGIFNEARARIGSIGLQSMLMYVQVHLLQATYFEANACHVEFWRSSMTASLICQLLVQYPHGSWSTLNVDLIKRAYWSCMINEDLYHLDLDSPRTGLRDFADAINLPHFERPQVQLEFKGRTDDNSLLEYHFLAKIALTRVISRICDAIHLHSKQSESLDDYQSPPVPIVREMARQLDLWRAFLPEALKWSDTELLSPPEIDVLGEHPATSVTEADPLSITPLSKLDSLNAELRARFYYARFILYRPFIFKAIHFVQHMNSHDAELCALALQSACLWPTTLRPVNSRKRLIPHLFSWTQNFIGTLLILWMSERNACLRQICAEWLDEDMVHRTIGSMLRWIKDIEQIDGVAEWGWRILNPIFAGRV